MTSDKIFELRAFYSELFESYLILSEDEISASLLDEEFKQRAIGWESFGKHIEYMRNKLESSNLNANRKELIASSLERQKAEYEKYLWQPEARMIVGEGDRQALVARRLQLAGGYYHSHEKEAWQQLEAEGYVADWVELPQQLIQEIDRKIQTLDDRLKGSPPALPIIVHMLTPAQEEEKFLHRWDEFRNVVNISFSSSDDDTQIIVYNPDNPPQKSCGAGLWYPMSLNGQTHNAKAWLGFSQQKKEAIRLGLMQGICKLIQHSGGSLVEWRARRDEFSPHLFNRRFNPIAEKAERTKQYAQGRAKIEGLLRTIYDTGQDIPYHPNFDQAFLTHLEQLPLYEVNSFLTGFCESENLENSNGYSYLLDLVTGAVDASTIPATGAIDRAISWLRTAYQSSTLEEQSKAASIQDIATAPPCILSPAELDKIAIVASLVKGENCKPTPISGTTASALWGMVEILEATTVTNPGGKSKLALWLADRYTVKMRDAYDGPNEYSITRTNAWLTCGNALVALDFISESQRTAAMTQLNSKKNKKLKPKVG